MKQTLWKTIGLGLGALLLFGGMGTAVVAQEGAAEAPAAAPVAADLPAADELVAGYVEAMGGRKAIEGHTSMKATGTFEMPTMGLAGDLVLYASAPDRQKVHIAVEGMGDIFQGFDGKVAWSDDPMTGPQVMSGAAAEEVARQSDFYPELNYRKIFPKMETVEQVEFAGQDTYKVRCENTSGTESFHYFAVDSGLLVGVEGEQETPMGAIFVTTEISDYEKFGDRMVATRMTQKMMGMEQVMTVSGVEYDGVDADAFELPESIRTLVEGSTGTPQ